MQSGQDILRMKGVLDFHGEARQFYFHSVHMLTDATPGKRWSDGAARISRMVVIGRKLDTDAIRSGFLSCAHFASHHNHA